MSSARTQAVMLAAGIGAVGASIFIALKYLRTPKTPAEPAVPVEDTYMDGIYQPLREGFHDGRFYTRNKHLAHRLKGVYEHCLVDGVEDPVPLWSIDGELMELYDRLRNIWKQLKEARVADKQDDIDRIDAVERKARKLFQTRLDQVATPLPVMAVMTDDITSPMILYTHLKEHVKAFTAALHCNPLYMSSQTEAKTSSLISDRITTASASELGVGYDISNTSSLRFMNRQPASLGFSSWATLMNVVHTCQAAPARQMITTPVESRGHAPQVTKVNPRARENANAVILLLSFIVAQIVL